MWPIMCKYDVIHKTGSTQYIATLQQEDRATAIGNSAQTSYRATRRYAPPIVADLRPCADRSTVRTTLRCL